MAEYVIPQIPSINNTPVKQLPKNTLVRFRCMVQDTGLGQEMFVSAYKDQDKIMCYRYTEDPVDVNVCITFGILILLSNRLFSNI